MRHRQWIVWTLVVLVAAVLAGCGAKKEASQTSSDSLVSANPTEQGQGNITPEQQVPPPTPEPTPPPPTERKRSSEPRHARTRTSETAAAPAQEAARSFTVPSGSAIKVTVNTKLSSETANVGDPWTGVVKENVVVDGRTLIPAGSTVNGTVTATKPAQKGDRAMLDLAVDGLNVEGKDYHVHATTEAIVAGSTRARNLGAIAGGAAAGALIGRAVGGSGKGALIGGLLGGAAAGGAVAKSKGYQVELKEGTEISFTTSEAVAIRR